MARSRCFSAAHRFYSFCLLADTPLMAQQLKLRRVAGSISNRKRRSIQNQTLRHRVAGAYSHVSHAAALYVESEAATGVGPSCDYRWGSQCCVRDLAQTVLNRI